MGKTWKVNLGMVRIVRQVETLNNVENAFPTCSPQFRVRVVFVVVFIMFSLIYLFNLSENDLVEKNT